MTRLSASTVLVQRLHSPESQLWQGLPALAVGTLPQGYIRNVPLPRVPRGQSAKSHIQVTTIPDYYETPYVVPTYDSPRGG